MNGKSIVLLLLIVGGFSFAYLYPPQSVEFVRDYDDTGAVSHYLMNERYDTNLEYSEKLTRIGETQTVNTINSDSEQSIEESVTRRINNKIQKQDCRDYAINVESLSVDSSEAPSEQVIDSLLDNKDDVDSLLYSKWDTQGVSVTKVEDNKVVATQVLCSIR